jgi:hypothetical protein
MRIFPIAKVAAATSRCLLVSLVLASCSPQLPEQGSASGRPMLFEGARLITGDGSAIEDSAFLVENQKITRVGKRGALQSPAGAVHVDLRGETVMPAMVDLHGHIGYQNVLAGTMSKENFTRDNLIDHLERLAYDGVGAVVDVASLLDRSDLKGGRTGWGDVPLKVRDEVIPNAALFKTAGSGIAFPNGGPTGHPSRSDVPYPVATEAEARAAVDDYVKMEPEFIKIDIRPHETNDLGG